MSQKLYNIFMTIRSALTLRNLLIFLCAAAFAAVTVKGFRVEAKIRQVRQADAFYTENRRIAAESAYAAALSNTVIRYREEQVRERLAELAPITRLREEILLSKSELLNAAETGDFEAFLGSYEVYADFGKLSLDGEFAAEYRELDQRYAAAETAAAGFSAFRVSFEQKLAGNLESGDYRDESAKEQLLRIPAAFFAGKNPNDASPDSAATQTENAQDEETQEQVKTDQLNTLLADYDRRKLKKLAAAGNYTGMLDEAQITLANYAAIGMEAPWVGAQAEETARTVLRKDLEASSYSTFASHARNFADFVSETGMSSDRSGWIETRIGELNDRAGSLITDGRFEEAIALYQALDGYADTAEAVRKAEEAWMEAEPLRILQLNDSSHTYSLTISGTDRFGADVYVAALDEEGLLHFGFKFGSGRTVYRAPQNLAAANARSLKIQEQLSDGTTPVVVIESESLSRKAVYTAIRLEGGFFTPMFRVEADGYTIEDGGQTLRAAHPIDAEEEGETAVYELQGLVFSFVELDPGIATEETPEADTEPETHTAPDTSEPAERSVPVFEVEAAP